MINISLPDGSVRSFDKPVSGADIAASIGPGLAKAALAVRIDGKMKDLATVIDHDIDTRLLQLGIQIVRCALDHLATVITHRAYDNFKRSNGYRPDDAFVVEILFDGSP